MSTTTFSMMAFLPELVLTAGALVLFVVTLGDNQVRAARFVSLVVAVLTLLAGVASIGQNAVLFDGAYRVDAFSQWLKIAFAAGYVAVVMLNRDAADIRADIRPEYFLFLGLGMIGFTLLVSSIDVLTLIVSLELSSFPLYLMVAMRREREGQRSQMESAIKYIMFGVAANGVMFFGLSYLYGLTGTTSLPLMVVKLQPVLDTPLAIAGLALAFAGLYYKLAVFPFHFWTPDVYQGAANETAGIIASLPKLGAVVILVRFSSLALPGNDAIVTLLAVLAGASMFYGNLIALVQNDLKRLLGFSGIAHAGYALMGFVALDQAGFAAALYYIVGYLAMVLACFVVISRVSRDGTNLAIDELAGLHKRSPLLAATLAVGVFALAGIPPFVGFMGKFTLLTAALAKGHTALVIVAVVNAAIAVYYYLRIVREIYFRDAGDRPAVAIDVWTGVLCTMLIVVVLALGVAPARIMDAIAESLPAVTAALP
jgi:NADH-quinone oxidoreductase subunit N